MYKLTIYVTVRLPVNGRLSVVKLGEWKAILRFLSAQEVGAPNPQAPALPPSPSVQGSTLSARRYGWDVHSSMVWSRNFKMEIK